jgi:hypothetical protein
LATHWFALPIGVNRSGHMAALWERGSGPLDTWDHAHVKQWAVDENLSPTVMDGLRSARMTGPQLAALTPEDVLQV